MAVNDLDTNYIARDLVPGMRFAMISPLTGQVLVVVVDALAKLPTGPRLIAGWGSLASCGSGWAKTPIGLS